MSLKKYEAFVRTVDLGSLTKAAQDLGSTQSRISHILSDLESEYGFCLMRRSRGGIELTEAGRLLLPKMREILHREQELSECIQEIRNANAGTVRIGVFTSVAVHWLPGMIRRFQAEHPGAKLEMRSGDYHDVDQWLREGSVDLGFVTLPGPEDMRIIPLAEDPLVAILPKDHRLAKLDKIPGSWRETPSSACSKALPTTSTGLWTTRAFTRISGLPPRTIMPSLPWWSRGWEFPSCPVCSSGVVLRIWRCGLWYPRPAEPLPWPSPRGRLCR